MYNVGLKQVGEASLWKAPWQRQRRKGGGNAQLTESSILTPHFHHMLQVTIGHFGPFMSRNQQAVR